MHRLIIMHYSCDVDSDDNDDDDGYDGDVANCGSDDDSENNN